MSGDILRDQKVRRLYPFFLLLAVIALLWIANTYYARSIQAKIVSTEKKLATATETLKQEKTKYVKKSQPAQLVRKLAKDSIEMAHNATNKVIADKEERSDNE